METTNRNQQDNQMGNFGSGKRLAGIIVVIVGGVLLARQVGADIPRWVISWEMLLIAIGFYIGIKHSFRNWVWVIPVLIGSVFMLDDMMPEFSLRPYFWPVLIISIGLFIMFRPSGRRRNWGDRSWNRGIHESGEGAKPGDTEEYLDSVSIFGGIEKNIVTKDFRGGDVTTFFGGSAINLSQADIKDRAVLNLTQVFGGAQLIIPANWKLQSEVVSIFGGIEDKRVFQKDQPADVNKTLVLKGTSVFGGIEIKSF